MKITTTGLRILCKRLQILASWTLILFLSGSAAAQPKTQMVRLAKLQIDPAQLDSYKSFLTTEIETSIRIEPGVLTLYAVAEKNNPAHITILEIYADTAAYKLHIQTPHFIRYKTGTKNMVKSLELIEALPIALGTKQKK
jgi:4-carboxymuconolactone decarboxylase